MAGFDPGNFQRLKATGLTADSTAYLKACPDMNLPDASFRERISSVSVTGYFDYGSLATPVTRPLT